MNRNLGKMRKLISKKKFISRLIMQFLENLWKNVRKHRDIKLVTTQGIRNYVV